MKYIILLLPLVLSGCYYIDSSFKGSTHQAYHMADTIQKVKGPRDSTATLAFLEFDDQGEPWRQPNSDQGWQQESHTQLPALLKELNRISEGGKKPVKTVIFIHGWNNSAEPGNSNLENFRHSLGQLATVSSAPVFGVFVAWRGAIAKVPIYLDVGSREATAARIGGPSLLAYLRAISTATHRDKRSSVTAIGHSFGAKILTQVTCNHLAAQIGAKMGESRGESQIQPLADTVILANTAENAALPLQLMNLMRDNRLKYHSANGSGRELPLIVSVCSLQDGATNKLLVYWNNIARKGLGLPHKGGAASNKIQDHALYNSMGFYGPLRSHGLRKEGKAVKDTKATWKSKGSPSWEAILRENVKLGAKWPLANGDSFEVALSSTGDPQRFEPYSVSRLTQEEFEERNYSMGAEANDTPFWFLQVPGFVSGGHGDLWNANFTGLVAAIESMRSPSPTAKSRGTLAPGPKPQLEVNPAY